MRRHPWPRHWGRRRYNPAMTTLLSAALPSSATAHVHPAAETTSGLLPAGLTDLDATRITAAISAARTESTRHVYALVWSQWERWCSTRGMPPGRSEAGRRAGPVRQADVRHLG